MANNQNNALQQIANLQNVEGRLRAVASPGNAAAIPLPMYPPGANADIRRALDENRLENENDLSNFLEQYLTTNEIGKETLLFQIALDDIANHMRSVQYDQDTLGQIDTLRGIVKAIGEEGQRVPDELAEEINNYIAFYHNNISGSLYSMLRQRYIEDTVEEMRKGRANVRRAQEAAELQAKANANRRAAEAREAQEAAERQAKANANRRANQDRQRNAAREAFLKRFSQPGAQPPSQRRSRRNRRSRRTTQKGGAKIKMTKMLNINKRNGKVYSMRNGRRNQVVGQFMNNSSVVKKNTAKVNKNNVNMTLISIGQKNYLWNEENGSVYNFNNNKLGERIGFSSNGITITRN